MSTFSPPLTSTASAAFSWLFTLATRAVACSLNMPEPLVHDTGVFLYVHVQSVENRAAKTFCPIRLFRHVQSWCRQPAR
jgi:hypothetical protein